MQTRSAGRGRQRQAGGRAGRARPEGVSAAAHLAYCKHVCAGPGLLCIACEEPRAAGTCSILPISAGKGSSTFPTQGRGGGAGRSYKRRSPEGWPGAPG